MKGLVHCLTGRLAVCLRKQILIFGGKTVIDTSLVVCDFLESYLHIKLNVVPFCKCVDILSVAIAILPRKSPKSDSKILSQPGIEPGTSC